MKKFIIISMIGLFFAGCKKSYECRCTHGRRGFVFNQDFVIRDTKKAATKKCDEKQTELRAANDEWSCSLE